MNIYSPLAMSTKPSKVRGFQVPETLTTCCQMAYGWSVEFTDRAILGYHQFIRLMIVKEDWDATILVPSNTIAAVWKQHVVHIGHYLRACHNYIGEVIDHYPSERLAAEGLGSLKTERIEATKPLLRAVFDRNYDTEV